VGQARPLAPDSDLAASRTRRADCARAGEARGARTGAPPAETPAPPCTQRRRAAEHAMSQHTPALEEIRRPCARRDSTHMAGIKRVVSEAAAAPPAATVHPRTKSRTDRGGLFPSPPLPLPFPLPRPLL